MYVRELWSVHVQPGLVCTALGTTRGGSMETEEEEEEEDEMEEAFMRGGRVLRVRRTLCVEA